MAQDAALYVLSFAIPAWAMLLTSRHVMILPEVKYVILQHGKPQLLDCLNKIFLEGLMQNGCGIYNFVCFPKQQSFAGSCLHQLAH